MARWLSFCGVVLVLSVAARSQTPEPGSAQWNAFVAEFLADARHVGEMTPAVFANELAHTKAQLARLRSIDDTPLSADERLDRRLAESLLVRREIEQERMRRWRMDPRIYMRSLTSLAATLNGPGDKQARASSVLRTLEAIPGELSDGQRNLTLNVARWQAQSLLLADTAANAFETGVPAFAESLPEQKATLLAANTAARNAVLEWVAFLKVGLPQRPTGYAAVGIETYDAILKGQHLLSYDSETLYRYSLNELDRTIEEIESVAAEIDETKKWGVLVAAVEAGEPDPGKPIDIYQQGVNAARGYVAGHHLIPVPWKERVDVVAREPRPLDPRYDGSFSSAADRPPAADGTLVGQWQINQDDTTTQNYLGNPDPAVILLMAHAAYGRHVQGLYQMHNASRLRREVGTPLFTDGWGLYSEQLKQEPEAVSDARAHLRQLQLRLWRIARVVVDVGIHTGKLTDAQAATLLTDRVGLVKAAAELEISASADAPAARLDYVGLLELLRIRDAFKDAKGAQFSLSDFHERLLEIGALPPALMREALMR